MKIDLLKTHLKHLVSLVKEYKEKIPDSLNEEIQELEKPVKSGLGIDTYDKQYLLQLKDERYQAEEDLFKQLIYFVEKILCELSKPFSRGFHFEIDPEKVREVIKSLSEKELELLSSLWEFHKSIEGLDCYTKDVYKPSEVKELQPEISRVMKSAISMSL